MEPMDEPGGGPYDFLQSYNSWSRIPVDDFEYLSAQELFHLHPAQFGELLDLAAIHRWSHLGWRNRDGTLAKFMRMKEMAGRTVLDFGCGLGLDSLQYHLNGAKVVIADLHPWILYMAQRTILYSTNGVPPERTVIIMPRWPFLPDIKIDLFWSFGVLHHTPMAGEILRRACQVLNPGGEARVLLYSDRRWELLMGCPVPEGPAWRHPRYADFVRACDSVGLYADFYTEEKLAKLVEGFAEVAECKYLCDDQFIGAVVRPKAKGRIIP